ncbi:AraC family transcriptional regulator [Pantoea rodasii]|uniref:AraC family transcriptional regulator n=1 Tax=Pantoea rodasii TaxID=1076549 RepID=A0A2M9W935_9GAMM|nr:AraC family transcriptional regulator [Pantoea rodasii]ORM63683.1 AraC family transcriptional regulator [Pantoea rodasii]PJZ04057.1 AraC family transcriptional regulator [Pantoea rodasii]
MSLSASDWFSRNGIECSRVSASGSRFPRHLHDEYVICANLSGREEIWLDGKVTDAFAGQVTLYNPSSIQSSLFSEQAVSFVSIHLPQSTLKALLGSAHAPVLREGVINDARLFEAICRFDEAARTEDEALLEQQLLWLCGELLADEASVQQGEAQIIQQVKQYLREHLHEKPQLEVLAQWAGLSKYHLVRRFTQLTGLPPLQYHMQLRLHQARDLLRQQVHPHEAALQLGFYDQSHFINAFRKVMGTTPHHYAQQIASAQHKFPIA